RLLHQELAVDHLLERLRHAARGGVAQLADRDLGAVHARRELRRRAVGDRFFTGGQRGREQREKKQVSHHSACARRRCATQPASARPARSSSHLSGWRPAETEKRGSAASCVAPAATRIGASSAPSSAGTPPAIGPASVRRYTSTNEYIAGCVAGTARVSDSNELGSVAASAPVVANSRPIKRVFMSRLERC